MATVIRTTTVTVNAAFLQEIKEVNAELWQLLDNLREACRSPLDLREHAGLFVDMLIELRDQLALHFALEEAYGYFEDPAVVFPAMSDRAAELRDEHRQLYLKANQLADDAEELLFVGNLSDLLTRVPASFWAFDRQLAKHESLENELILRQFEDVGVGD